MEIKRRYYTSYHSSFEDIIADNIEADLLAKHPSEVAAMTRSRGRRLEQDAHALLTKIIRPDSDFKNACYPNPDDPTSLMELDLLMWVDDVLLIVGSKAGGRRCQARSAE
jgi:hypothetical protein